MALFIHILFHVTSGVRLFDIESMSRVAHIDRPIGARSSLYPTISSLHPSILFERSDSLLIAWGDCLMSMLIRDSTNSSTSPSTSSNPKDAGAPKELKRKTVECTMAWELDCVACGVAPVDEHHVAVLGLVPSPPHSSSLMDEIDESLLESKSCLQVREPVAGGDNILELQIISRKDGTSISNDRLPLLNLVDGNTEQHVQVSIKKNYHNITVANALEFSLLSSFVNPRMDDIAEWEALDDTEREIMKKEIDDSGSELFSDRKFPDLHLRWSMSKDICSICVRENDDNNELPKETIDHGDEQSEASNNSVLSDDYVFVLSEPIENLLPDPVLPSNSSPPIMVVLYSYDACLVQTRDIDDAISYFRSLGKPALALKQALVHRRDVKRHGLDQLIDEYFVSLLRMGGVKSEISMARKRSPKRANALSFSRLKIASQSMPMLLGGDSRMWQRWIFMFARIPGGLFVIREKIPVRGEYLLFKSGQFVPVLHSIYSFLFLQ